MSERILLVGATSGIGRALARALGRRGAQLVLAARSKAELERIGADLETRYETRATLEGYDAHDPEGAARLLEAAERGGPLDGVILCHGIMYELSETARDPEKIRAQIETNYVSAVVLLEAAAALLEARGAGHLCALSSVAGDRGRQSNYLYGSTKAGLDAYLEGLEARLAKAGVAVVTVKPGFVDTGLTWGRPVPFAASPERVARDVLRGIDRRRSVVYTPGYWRFIMALLRLLPRSVFRRLPL